MENRRFGLGAAGHEDFYAHINCFIKRRPNLGATAAQRGESFHGYIKKGLHASIPIKEAVNRIVRNTNEKMKQLRLEEEERRYKYNRK